MKHTNDTKKAVRTPQNAAGAKIAAVFAQALEMISDHRRQQATRRPAARRHRRPAGVTAALNRLADLVDNMNRPDNRRKNRRSHAKI